MDGKTEDISKMFLDEIEAQIIMGRICTIKFQNEQGASLVLNSRITKLYEEDDVYYVLIDGLRVPFTRLLEVNGIQSRQIG